jgi:hypothetical protein
MTDIAQPAMPSQMPASSAVVYHPSAEPDAEPHVAARAIATPVQGPAMPVRECGCCGATVGRMMPSEIVCPRRRQA